jgi:hypothetical protein
MVFGKYPFDTQKCPLQYSTFSMTKDEIDLRPGYPYKLGPIPGVNTTDSLLDLEFFGFSSYTVSGFIVDPSTMTTAANVGVRHVINGEFTFVRDPKSFWLKYFLPTILLHAALWVNFWISSAAAPARVTICIIAMLSFRIMMVSIYSEIPLVSYSVWVIDFMAASQVLAIVALLEFGK